MDEMKKKYVLLAIVALAFCIIVSDPVRMIRLDAMLNGCNRTEVMAAQFEKVDDISMIKAQYRTQSTLPDKLTGSGHSEWYVYHVLFVNIPKWAGNG